MEPIGIAVIGCGSISGVHLQAISKIESAKLLAVVDIDKSLAEKSAQLYGCTAYTDYHEVLQREDIEVVHICTGHYLHAPMAVDALKAGKHVLTEKPMAESDAAARIMLEAAETHPDVQLGVIFQNRYNPASVMMKKYVDSGELGRLICLKGMVTWFRDPDYYETEWKGKWATEGGGVLINQAIHTLDLMQWLGGEVASIKGSISTDSLEGVIEVEDTAHAHLEFQSGATGIFYATNSYKTNSPVELELIFEKGMIQLKGEHLYLEQDGTLSLLSEPTASHLDAKSYWGLSHGAQIEDFYVHVREGRLFWLNGPEGYKAFKLVMDIYESSRTGKRITYREPAVRN
ncbi:oxidoreductase [Paenibacillus selenitireducens]|uniref:Oxidoreductase n=1 Tax=Paenibacillus selenitireducens TaxID=1324314 RepID=A0A1T2X1R9_9BACL|nr:Gfo/Idh/MocA family oxidoreductase [Paenibacillus selenitireducens]OPA73814.1 oxidoreductase [Paenibacillus selenitireducens]